LKSEEIPIQGIGMQWHINTSRVITADDQHYQIAQRFIEMNGGYEVDPNAREKKRLSIVPF
jgi:GH35 family endo-1,4-beta-xylanase